MKEVILLMFCRNTIWNVNGVVVKQGRLVVSVGMDATFCQSRLVPRFSEWNHLSDLSLYEELRLFNKALAQEEIESILNGG